MKEATQEQIDNMKKRLLTMKTRHKKMVEEKTNKTIKKLEKYIDEIIIYYIKITDDGGDLKIQKKVKIHEDSIKTTINFITPEDFLFIKFNVLTNGDIIYDDEVYDNLFERKKRGEWGALIETRGEKCCWYNEYESGDPPKKDVKYCSGCDEVKDVNNFYKSGNKKYLQSKCKKCSNGNRKNYKRKKVKREKKLKGFEALSEEMQKSILNDLHIKLTKKSIAKKNKLNYQSFLRWIKKDTFPKY
jgi:hypothetical protein